MANRTKYYGINNTDVECRPTYGWVQSGSFTASGSDGSGSFNLGIQDEGVTVLTGVDCINFIGDGVVVRTHLDTATDSLCFL